MRNRWSNLSNGKKVLYGALVLIVGLPTILIVLAALMGGPTENLDASPSQQTTTSQPPITLPSTSTTTQATTTTTARPTTTTTTRSTFEAFTIEGSGDDVVDLVVPNNLPALVELTHSGRSNFIVVAYSASGDRIGSLVNEIGAYSGHVPLNFLEGDEAAELEIRADGKWKVTVSPIWSAPVFTTHYSGKGDKVVLYNGRGTRLAATHTGRSNFIVHGYGSRRYGLINEIGLYDGTVRLPSDTVVIVVRADGSWTLSAE